jgi:ubiquinone/menaquinone biosynthesis C-methylase UbiE
MSNEISAEKIDKIDKAYSSTPFWYDLRGFFILTLSYQATLWEQISFFSKNMKQEHLEIAMGTGTLLDYILRYRRFTNKPKVNITGFDYAESMLNGARHRFSNRPEVKLLRADATNLEFKDNSFDSASIANAIHCFPEVMPSLKETFRVLKPGGTLAVNVLIYPHSKGLKGKVATAINNWGIKKGILITPYEESDIRNKILEAGFKIQSDFVSGNTYNIVAEK